MARPRQFDPVVVEEALLGVFWSRGYARTSIGQLTEATGLLRGSLYAAYGDKENMYRTAVKLYIAELAAQLATEKVGLDAVQLGGADAEGLGRGVRVAAQSAAHDALDGAGHRRR